MNKNWLGIIGVILVIVVLVWLLGGSRISCHDRLLGQGQESH